MTNSLTVNLAGSGQVAPTYFLNPDNGVSYSIVMQTPQYQINSLQALEALPITAASTANPPILGGIASITRTVSSAVVSQYDIQPMFQIFATPQGRDLGALATDVRKAIADTAADVPRGSSVVLLGQVQTMDSAFSGLLFGLLAADRADLFPDRGELPVLVRSVRDHHRVAGGARRDHLDAVYDPDNPLGAGLDRRHHVHGRRHRQQRAGDLVCARALRALGDPVQAAIEAGFVRFRPVLMTALAMVIGMTPMALGLGEGGEQNAPLGRAVIGGLVFATTATLMFVPVVFSMVHKKQGAKAAAPLEMQHAH